MERWIRPLGVLALLALLAGACSASGDDTATTTTIAPTTTLAEPATTTATVAPEVETPVEEIVDVGAADTYSVMDFGAVADGKNDDSPAFQAAVDAAAIDGGVVLVPSVGGRSAYVLNKTIVVPTGVSIIGALAGTGLDVGGPYPWPDTNLTGTKILARPSPADEPLFRLAAGTTVRGLWITYDQQPMPSDAEFADVDSDYEYLTFDAARTFFVEEHVVRTAPTFYIERGDQVRIQDIVADRYFDFLYMKEGGPLWVDGVWLYGYNRGFTIENSDAVNEFTNITFAPSVGPFVPGTGTAGDTWSWVFGAVASQIDNLGFHFGQSDGFVIDNVAFQGGNTAIRLGASFEYPIVDPLTETFFTSGPGLGPWGQISNVRVDQAAVGVHLVWPSQVAVEMSNVSVSVGIDDGRPYDAATGSGILTDMSRQAFLLAEPSYTAENNGLPDQLPALLASNVTVGSRAEVPLYAEAAATVDQINGRVFLVDGEFGMEINGFSLGLPYDDSFMVGAGPAAGEVSVRIRGVLAGGRPQSDKLIQASGVSVLSGEIVVVETPAPAPAPAPSPTTTTAPSTSAAPDTTTATDTTVAP